MQWSPFSIVAEIGDYTRQCGQALRSRNIIGGVSTLCHPFYYRAMLAQSAVMRQ